MFKAGKFGKIWITCVFMGLSGANRISYKHFDPNPFERGFKIRLCTIEVKKNPDTLGVSGFDDPRVSN